jgi:hypothetical protein
MECRANKNFRTNYSKEELKKLIDNAKTIKQYQDGRWDYPDASSNNGNNAFMQMSFETEYSAGILIFIPTDSQKTDKLNTKHEAITKDSIKGRE